jgi:hypothetical protein
MLAEPEQETPMRSPAVAPRAAAAAASLPPAAALAAVLALALAAGVAGAGCVPRNRAQSEVCGNGVDDDGDGQVDCDDPSCAGASVCNVGPGDEDCANGVDDDDDGLVDCDDVLDCGGLTMCRVEDCNNAADDDGDGDVDCDDADCAGAIGCGAEDCGDGVDNDGDGLVDCIDQDCQTACIPENCTNGTDDNGDGLADCDDPDCATTATECVDENCTNGVDDDFDSLVDCLDEECAIIFPGCIESCTDGIDNDQDGYIDCADLGDCGADPVCIESICTDGLDNEGDGLIDCVDPDCGGDPTCTAPGIYELFTSGTDIDNHTITFTPSGGGYTWAVATATVFPTTPGTGAPSSAGPVCDDCTVTATFGTLSLTLFGVAYSSGFMSSNGRLLLSTADAAYVESAAGFFTQPQIGALWDDLNSSASGTTTVDRFTDRMVFTWNAVPEFAGTALCSMQIQWFTSGNITITHLACANLDGLTGISGGNPLALPVPPAVNFVP